MFKKIQNAFNKGIKNADEDDKNQTALAFIASDHFPIIESAKVNLTKYNKIPLSEIAALGSVFSQLSMQTRTVVQSVTTNIAAGQPLFVGINPKGVEGYLNFNEFGTVGNIMQMNEKGQSVIAGRMRFKEVGTRLPIEQVTKTKIPIDPMTMMVAAALLSINQKLTELQKTTEEILRFLKLDKQSKLRGNLNMLAEILEEYKHHCDDENLRNLRNVAVQSIKREAHQNILFYQEQINHHLKNQAAIHSGKAAENMLSSVISEFSELRLAGYLYSFSSFLDMLLQQRFEGQGLENSEKNMHDFTSRYKELYEKSYGQIANYHETAIESQALGGIGRAAKSLGQAIASVRVLREGPVDEFLINAGESISKQSKERLKKQMDRLATLEDCGIQPFVDSIQTIKLMHSQPYGMITDGENLFVLKS